MTEEIIIDESNATEFNYTLKSINKVVGCKFVKESYTPKEICELLKQFCMVLDLKILEAKGEKCKLFDIEKINRNLLEQIDRLEQENKELKEEIQFHNKENSNLLAERNAAQIGYDEIREVRECYRSALEEIRKIIRTDCKRCTSECDCDDDCTRYKIQNKINEVLE